MTILVDVQHGARLLVAGAFALSAIVAATHWAVRRGSIAAFGAWARTVRRIGDPVLMPLERRLVRAGANPQDAPIWLLGVIVIAGLAFIALIDWACGFVLTFAATAQSGQLLAFLVQTVFELLKLAIMIRVIASWVGASRYSKLMRPFYLATDWLVEPIRRVLPPFGMFDLSPLAAYFVLYFGEQVVMRGLF